jgi:hypothetical protein
MCMIFTQTTYTINNVHKLSTLYTNILVVHFYRYTLHLMTRLLHCNKLTLNTHKKKKNGGKNEQIKLANISIFL